MSTLKKPSSRVVKNHPDSNIVGSLDEGLHLRKGKRVEEALQNENWVDSMHENLNQLVRNDVWELVPRPENVHVINTKWIFKNKNDEDGEIIRNKSRLVAQGYT